MTASMGERVGTVELLARAVAHLLGTSSPVATFHMVPADAENSATSVRRYEVEVGGAERIRVVVKACSLRERIVLALLDGAEAVPRAFVEDTSSDRTVDVVMMDAGDSASGLDGRAKRLAAEALSEVHVRFLGRDAELSRLPGLTEEYLRDVIVSGCWRRAWVTSLADQRFQHEFGSWVPSVEASAADLPVDLLSFSHRLQLNTLAHTDIRPERLRDVGERALVLGWREARCAPLFLDVGNIFDTQTSGWIYRDALAARGVLFDDDVFSRGHLLARRFAGIRYLRFRLASWLAAPGELSRDRLQRTLAMAAGTTSDAA